MDNKDLYEVWLKRVKDTDLINELNSIKNNKKEKHERFYKFLEFGTAGIRGLMGAGTNRLNVYTIGKISQGLSDYLNSKSSSPSVVISYDSRNNSEIFARRTAEVMAGNSIKVYLVRELQPTPFLSFAVRYLKCTAGIMITASHNTSEYNGYKCYGSDGAQITENEAQNICQFISEVDIFDNVKSISLNESLENKTVSYIDESVYEEYLKSVLDQRVYRTDISNLDVIYTPLNGCGNKMVCESLKRMGVKKLRVVSEQMYPDGNFSTCRNPNPELFEAFELALKDAEKFEADLIIATDPDADRLGACVRHKGEYKLLNGNQIGVLLFYYIIKNKTNLPINPVVIKTLVSTKMINVIAEKFGCDIIEVFTGFKNIARQVLELENKNEISRYVFGFEESNGYLCGTYTRDKDAISASALLCEAASYFKKKGLTLLDIYESLSKEYGYYGERSIGFAFSGSEGILKINKIISNIRVSCPEFLGDFKINNIIDYSIPSKISNNVSNVITLKLNELDEIIIRPSGTEPKLKVYILAHESNKERLTSKLNKLTDSIKTLVNSLN